MTKHIELCHEGSFIRIVQKSIIVLQQDLLFLENSVVIITFRIYFSEVWIILPSFWFYIRNSRMYLLTNTKGFEVLWSFTVRFLEIAVQNLITSLLCG